MRSQPSRFPTIIPHRVGVVNTKYNDINAIINESILLTKKQAAFKDINVRKELSADLPQLHLDKGQMRLFESLLAENI